MKEYIQFLENLKDSLKELNIEFDDSLIKEIKTTELLIPIVGGFSAGKSSLINAFLKEDILPVDVTPETALASEIRYSEKNYIEAVKERGSDVYKLNEIEKIKENVKNYKYLKYFINDTKILEIEPLILVDMPGFSAPIKIHNDAIMNYLDKGVYFIIVMSIESGNINKKLLQEIEFISEFRDFTFCINKVNLKPKEEVEEIKEYVKEQLEDLGYDKDIFLLDGRDLGKVIKSIDVKEIYKKLFLPKIEDLYFKIESELNTKISTLKSSKKEVFEIIENLNKNIENIKLKKEETIKNIENRYLKVNVDNIINRVTNEIEINKMFLIDKLIKRQDIEEDLNIIIRNILSKEINRIFDKLTKDIIEDFRVSIEFEFNGFDIDREWINKISQSVEIFIKSSLNGLEILSNRLKNSKNWYKSIASILAIITNVLNPIVEVILVFLPDLLESVLKSYQEQKAKEKLLNEFNTQIIPQIRLRLKSELPFILEKEINSLIEAISQKFEEELQDKKEEIEDSIKEKEANLENIENELKLLEEKRNCIKNLKEKFFSHVKG